MAGWAKGRIAGGRTTAEAGSTGIQGLDGTSGCRSGGAVQGRLQVGGDFGGFLFESVSGDANDAVVGGDQATVALAVVAKGAAGAVGGEAVELDDDALGGPDAVDFVAPVAEVDLEVQAWTGEAVVVEEGEEGSSKGLRVRPPGSADWRARAMRIVPVPRWPG